MISSVTTTRYDDLRRIEAEVGTLIRRVKRVMGERAREVHPELHPMTYFILTHLAQHGPLRAADLSDAFGMDKGGVSRQVQTLVDLGLVERHPAAEDRRSILLDASDEGRERLEAMTRTRSNRFDERLVDLAEPDPNATAPAPRSSAATANSSEARLGLPLRA